MNSLDVPSPALKAGIHLNEVVSSFIAMQQCLFNQNGYLLFPKNLFSVTLRKPPENADYGGESDLQGLVSNILDDADSQDSFYSEGYVIIVMHVVVCFMLQCAL